MSSLKIIKKRITSVKNTQKITRAMKLVSAAKLRRATERAQASRPYEKELLSIVTSIFKSKEITSEWTTVRDTKKVLLVVIATDRGLCGGLNSNLFKIVNKRIAELKGVEIEAVAIGKKARDFLKKKNILVKESYVDVLKKGNYAFVQEISKKIREMFSAGETDAVELFYSEFKSAILQLPTNKALLPFATITSDAEVTGELPTSYLLEPEGEKLLEKLLPMLIDFQLYRATLEAAGSEHGARMSAMENATRNAGDMISSLTLQRNRARQAAITKELMEIIGGAEALAG